jgi:hypothetical protein
MGFKTYKNGEEVGTFDTADISNVSVDDLVVRDVVNNIFSAVASNTSTAIYSTDGITWTESTLPISKQWNSVTYGTPALTKSIRELF